MQRCFYHDGGSAGGEAICRRTNVSARLTLLGSSSLNDIRATNLSQTEQVVLIETLKMTSVFSPIPKFIFTVFEPLSLRVLPEIEAISLVLIEAELRVS